MNRNSNSHFAMVPTSQIMHSKFPMVQNIRTTFNMGEIIPFYVDSDAMPGDHFTYHFTMILRQSTPLYPTMDNSYADIYFFRVPHRILWTHFKNQMGEVKDTAWFSETEYTTPMFTAPAGGLKKGCTLEKMGIPIGVAGIEFSQLPTRAYTMIYNYYFRDQNLIAPVEEFTDDTDRTASNTVSNLGGEPYKAAKRHDYFTSCLPAPQRGPAVKLPIGTSAPVIGTGTGLGLTTGNEGRTQNGSLWRVATSTTDWKLTALGQDPSVLPNSTITTGPFGSNSQEVGVSTNPENSGLIADLSNAIAATINAQRYAFQTQKIYEKDARGGARFNELIWSHFLTRVPDSRYQIPEYLGGKRIPITISQVLQTSQGTSGSPLGATGAFSLTVDSSEMFKASFTEWSIIIGLIVVRQDHSYSQGINRMWSRKRRFDYYLPSLAHIGEQPVYNKEIFAQGTDVDNEVFGYQEAWAEYRYKPSLNTGEFNPVYEKTLASWHYGDKYDNLPVLGQQWIEETKVYLDRTLAVTSEVQDQYLMDSLVSIKALRPMPTFSVPGLVDHY